MHLQTQTAMQGDVTFRQALLFLCIPLIINPLPLLPVSPVCFLLLRHQFRLPQHLFTNVRGIDKTWFEVLAGHMRFHPYGLESVSFALPQNTDLGCILLAVAQETVLEKCQSYAGMLQSVYVGHTSVTSMLQSCYRPHGVQQHIHSQLHIHIGSCLNCPVYTCNQAMKVLTSSGRDGGAGDALPSALCPISCISPSSIGGASKDLSLEASDPMVSFTSARMFSLTTSQ